MDELLGQVSAPSASTVFYLTLLFIFLTAIITTLLTRYSKDKCLKLFNKYHVTVVRNRGQTGWGNLKVFSSGIEVMFDHPFTDVRGHRKTSHLLYQADMDSSVLLLCRVHDELDAHGREHREKQVRRTFNPGPLKRAWRGFRNAINALRDGFNAAFGAVVAQASKANPSSAVLATQANSVTQIGQTLLGKFGNAFEPLLEQYIGMPVIIDVADPLNPNNAVMSFSGFLADYTQGWVAVFNVEHKVCGSIRLVLPEVEEGPLLPPLPPPPPIGAPTPVLPAPLKVQEGIEVRVDGKRLKLLNTHAQAIVVRRLEREGLEAVEFGTVVPPNATFDIPIRDAHGGSLLIHVMETLDVVAPRKFAVVRHAGTLVERPGFADELQNLDLPQLPRIPKTLQNILHEDVTNFIKRK